MPNPLILTAIQDAFNAAANPDIAVGQALYMKSHFQFLGLRKPVREQLQKQLFRQYPIATEAELWETVRTLWQWNQREFHYVAQELAAHYAKHHTASALTHIEWMARHQQWWDSIDFIAPKLIGPLLARHPELLIAMDDGIADDNLWMRRCAIIYQLKYKALTDADRLFRYCRLRQADKPFFIRKAIGWALREYSKTNPAAVRQFIQQEAGNLSPLSVREGSKYI